MIPLANAMHCVAFMLVIKATFVHAPADINEVKNVL